MVKGDRTILTQGYSKSFHFPPPQLVLSSRSHVKGVGDDDCDVYMQSVTCARGLVKAWALQPSGNWTS